MPTEPSPYLKSLQRLGRFFEFGLRRPAMPTDVASSIEHAIESDKPHFRYPVGPDAQETIAARARVSDDEWIALNSLQGDVFYDRWKALVGVDYYRD